MLPTSINKCDVARVAEIKHQTPLALDGHRGPGICRVHAASLRAQAGCHERIGTRSSKFERQASVMP